MADRVPDKSHREAIARHEKLLADQEAERKRLTAELNEAEVVYREWVNPKTRVEAARRDQNNFHTQSAAIVAESRSQVASVADKRIHDAIRSLVREQEQVSQAFAVREPQGLKSNPAARDARIKAIRTAVAELESLLFVACDDVPATLRETLRKIPTLTELEHAHA